MKLSINPKLAAAVATFRAIGDIRFYLHGIYVEPLQAGGVVLVATNGHALCAWRDATGEAERSAVLPANTASKRYARVKQWLDTHPDTTSWDANPWVWVIEFKRLKGSTP